MRLLNDEDDGDPEERCDQAQRGVDRIGRNDHAERTAENDGAGDEEHDDVNHQW